MQQGLPWATSPEMHKGSCRTSISVEGDEGSANANVLQLYGEAGSVLPKSAFVDLLVAPKTHHSPCTVCWVLGVPLLVWTWSPDMLKLALQAGFWCFFRQLRLDGEGLTPEVSCLCCSSTCPW